MFEDISREGHAFITGIFSFEFEQRILFLNCMGRGFFNSEVEEKVYLVPSNILENF